jgi:Glycosyltransferases involved in cell wall biogenesis
MVKLLSVIVPVFNMEKYLQATLDSLVFDRMDLVEVLIINDGSTDRSSAMAHDWADRYPGVATVIDKPNGGHGSAWNKGVELASGRYLAFLDSDDWVQDIAGFVDWLESAQADLVFTDNVIYREKSGLESVRRLKGIAPGVHSIDEEGGVLLENDCCMFNFHDCIYKASLLKPLMPLFHEKTSYDDMILSTAPLSQAVTFEYSQRSFYVYRLGRGEQSMAPAVISRKIHQQEAERKYAIDFAMARFPKEDVSLKARALHEIVRAICVTFYNYVMKLEPERREQYLKSWTEYVAATVPAPKLIFEYRAYVGLPRCFYGLSLKFCHLFREFGRLVR